MCMLLNYTHGPSTLIFSGLAAAQCTNHCFFFTTLARVPDIWNG